MHMCDQPPNETMKQPDGFHRSLLSNAPVAVVATDADLRIFSANPAAVRILNKQPKELIGRPLVDILPPENRDELQRQATRTAADRHIAEMELDLPAGTDRRRLLVILSPVPDAPGTGCDGVAAWLIDRTRESRIAKRLAQSEKMASLGTLAGGVAHHFNNILGGVSTFVDYAIRSNNPANMRRALEMTSEAAARTTRITQSLLSFAEHGGKKRDDLVDLTEVVLTFVHLVERPLAERKIQLKLDLQPLPAVPVEAQRMHQVLGNLLSNAEDAIADGGTITIRIDQEADNAVLTFADDGEGIAPGNQPQIFEPFFTTRGLLAGGDKNNPGLGLSVVHGLVQEMGGDISVESTPGEGTSFTITLPIREA